MPQFTQLNLQGKSEKKSDSKSQPNETPGFIGKQTIALFSGAVLATALVGGLLLETSGCSRENDTAVAIQRPITQPITPSAAPVQETTPVAAPAPVAKKVVKKRPMTALYADKSFGVSFRYPKRYVVKPVDSSKSGGQSALNFAQPGGLNLVSVELPKNSYPHTDLASATFNVSVNPDRTAAQCSQFALLEPASADQPAVLPAQVKLAGMNLQTVEAVTGPETSQSDVKYYHAFVDGACYEFALGITTQARIKDAAEAKKSEDEVAPVDRALVFRRLQNILATVKIEPAAAPEVPETATVAPATPTAPAADVASK